MENISRMRTRQDNFYICNLNLSFQSILLNFKKSSRTQTPLTDIPYNYFTRSLFFLPEENTIHHDSFHTAKKGKILHRHKKAETEETLQHTALKVWGNSAPAKIKRKPEPVWAPLLINKFLYSPLWNLDQDLNDLETTMEHDQVLIKLTRCTFLSNSFAMYGLK